MITKKTNSTCYLARLLAKIVLMKKLLSLGVCFLLLNILRLSAQSQDNMTPNASSLEKLEKEAQPTSLDEGEIALTDSQLTDHIDDNCPDKTKSSLYALLLPEEKTKCVNVSPGEKTTEKEEKKNKPLGKEEEKTMPKCESPKPKEEEVNKKKKSPSARVKLVSYQPQY